MPKAKLTKVKLSRSDLYRTVLTDTTPFEVPIIFSNDGFYRNLIDYKSKSPKLQKLIHVLVCKKHKFTIPLRYNIVKDTESIRTLSLIHPHGQLEIAKFYEKYHNLICRYTKRSPYSIRCPEKVGTSFYFKSEGHNENKYKRPSIDTIEIEDVVRNPASYFSYSGFHRLYLFFRSEAHIRLEKKYKFRMLLDVSKCFDSIYTHTISWAVKNKRISKNFTNASTFGNRFDRLMQHINHNETSGICIGPETSRIFAEIILAKVDQIVLENLVKKKIFNRADYECKRYVDNYYIFANSEEILSVVQHEFSIVLREYKLHLNLSKKETLTRPFYSQKSLIIDKVNQSIEWLWGKTLESEEFTMANTFKSLVVFTNTSSLFGNFTRQVQAACVSSNLGYDAIANYIVAAMKRKLIELCDKYRELQLFSDQDYCDTKVHFRQFALFILDVGFYFFTLHPTVASSFRLSHAMVVSAQHMKKNDPEGLDLLHEITLRWSTMVVKSPTLTPLLEKRMVVPVEFLNLLLALQEFSTDGVEPELLRRVGLGKSDDQYFQIIVQLFIYKDSVKFTKERDAVFKRAHEKLKSELFEINEAEFAHMLFDLLSCPYISANNRKKLLHDVWPKLKNKDPNIGNLSKQEAKNLVDEIEQQHWFVWWSGIDLRNLIEKKELSAVYA